MNVVVAIDSFKGSMTSLEAGKAIQDGIKKACDGTVYISPIADGGEGTVEALVSGMNGEFRESKVTDPLGRTVSAQWGIIDRDGIKTAIIEMAAAAGIVLLKNNELNPLKTTTYGVGELIKAAVSEGLRRFIVGIGGSSTNDGGVGMLQALGYDFLDEAGNQIPKGAGGLKYLKRISDKKVIPELKDCTFRVACDVKNPLCGENGCSEIYGPQKGATLEMIRDMDKWLHDYASLSGGDMNYPGTGAAGGMGYAFLTFMNASLEPGINIVLEETGLEQLVKNADIVVTGEGRMDSQTVMGKVPVGVANIAKKYGKKVIAFCGCATEDAGICNEYGIDAYFP
ncbi:MAG: glycerate kinase, partial [Lachnospiraceae bacterium]|nr:glycerate kinase [Lachnospiraceae bacterium]